MLWFQYVEAAPEYKQGEENQKRSTIHKFLVQKCERQKKFALKFIQIFTYIAEKKEKHMKREFNSMWMKITELKYQ